MENMEKVEHLNTENKTDEQVQELENTEKKYTDEDVSKIVKKRLAQERKKFEKLLNPVEDELETREKEITKRELRAEAKERLNEKGLPTKLADIINVSSKEDFEESYKIVIEALEGAFEQYGKNLLAKTFATKPPRRQNQNTIDIKSAFAPK